MTIEQTNLARDVLELLPDVDGEVVLDISRALRWELLNGPMPPGYWAECDELERYGWRGWTAAVEDLADALSGLPTIYRDADAGCLTTTDPREDPYNWLCAVCDDTADACDCDDPEPRWIGPDAVETVDPIDAIAGLAATYIR